MEALIDTLTPIEAWHWVALGLILIGIEVAAGTFDLLLVGIAALATALFAAIMPGAMNGWEWQVSFFAISAIALIVLSRTVFAGMRTKDNNRPGLSQRMVGMIGSRGVVTADFVAGAGRVKIGDTEWSAQSLDGSDIKTGQTVEVDSTEMTVLKVKVT